MLASFPTVPKTSRLKPMNIDVFYYPTVVWLRLSREPLRISAQTLCRQKLASMAYIFAADSLGLSSFNFFVVGSERRIFCVTECVSAVQGHPGLSKVIDFGTNRKGVYDFLLVVNSNFGPILHRFWDTASYWLKICEFFLAHPCLTTPFRGNPSEFLDETYRSKTTVRWKLHDLSFNRFWLIHPCDGRTDRQNCRSIYRAQHSVAR